MWGRNKNHAVRTYSELCQREFASKGECEHGEVLFLLQQAGVIKDLQYQIPFQLCLKPNIKITLDYSYKIGNVIIYDEVKGKMEREFRVKLAWLEEKHGITPNIIKPIYIRKSVKKVAFLAKAVSAKRLERRKELLGSEKPEHLR